MSETATDPSISTRTLADVKQHRCHRVADLLRKLADRIESRDVDIAVAQFHRETEDITIDGAENRIVRPQRGQVDDETITIQLQLAAYPVSTPDSDPED